MKYTCFLIMALIMGCHSPQKKVSESSIIKPPVIAKNLLLQPGGIDKAVAQNHSRLKGVTGDFAAFKNYLATLKNNDVTSIPFALDYIKTCLPADLAEKDSVLFLFNQQFFAITNPLSDSLETKYPKLIDLLQQDKTSPQLKAFRSNLEACGIGIYSTEGTYYLDVLPDYFYTNFKSRVSPGVEVYWDIRRKELAQGFSEDAGLLISFEQLYQRVKRWEKFMHEHPGTVYNNEANNYYTTYLETLLTGMDNTSAFDGEGNTLLPEVKAIYEKAIKDEPESPTSKLLTSYYNFLARHNFKQNDSVAVFLKENKLSAILGVQPDTR